MEAAKSRSALCASKIVSSNPLDSFRRLAHLFVSTEDSKILKERYEKFAGLEGPIGADRNFADSPEWTGRNNPSHTDSLFINTTQVIYCAPDLGEYDDGLNGPKKWDNARQRVLADKSALVLIQKDIAAQGWDDKNLKVEATTITAPPTLLTREEAARISDTITFNPIWLEHRIQEGGLFFSDETFEKMKKKGALAELKKEWKDGKRATPIDSLIEDLSVTLHHEMFHLSAFGSHNDLPAPDPRAYFWMNNIEYRFRDNPELMAILALIFDLKQNRKVTVNKDGELK
ncbi:uncharacterized protein BKA55DRAFT_692333 [Fusarium redolens]|uniref:Uncharacterized protein n=1 Tax=Fusarium redolens TaxID=48865 RepID=A0A9P9GTN0_FUSRE|nr:uncharacterized protein BKA55DRAFT_692333 [Fusarium redolens]KAH7244532.1 hypothetical protein BKA55DRAFT_692333 [Fusarium redolens]